MMIEIGSLICLILLLIMIFVLFGVMIHFYKILWEEEEKLRNDDKEDK